MMTAMYDVIVVGARCAGSSLAMLLARRGHRVLLVDRAAFPSDTVSSHLVHPPGVERLDRWGLLPMLMATGCPPLPQMRFDLEGITFRSRPPMDTPRDAVCPRRHVLDPLLADAAVRAGAEFRPSFTVKELVTENDAVVGIRGREHGGGEVTDRARIVVGADGVGSAVARLVGAERYREHAPLTHAYYSYWSGIDASEVEWYGRPGLGVAVAPTHHGLTGIAVGLSTRDRPSAPRPVEAAYLEALHQVERVAERVREGRMEERVAGRASHPNVFRTAFGPGWALVGDAGYAKDPTPAQGISDAFRDAELLDQALDDGLAGERPMEDALADYAERRDREALPGYEFTMRIAELKAMSQKDRQVTEAIADDQRLSDRWGGMFAGTVTPAEFLVDMRTLLRELRARRTGAEATGPQ
ncbi:MAG TPA: NAD(P)/FAD-dependent oxidoreductase [Actinomycetota bacterium]|nr:NAD(P)/FAD-dependent oxidoreductase [Actinomycetota bacterium]